MRITLLFACIVALVFSSCKIEKRVHRPGYHVEWAHAKKRVKPIASPQFIATEKEPILSASTANSLIDLEPNISILVVDTCDNIILRNGEEISAQVIEVGTAEIKYRKCQNIKGPLYSINKKEVFMIKYVNGTKDIMPEPDAKTKNGGDPFFNDQDYGANNGNNTNATPIYRKAEGFGIAGFFIVLSSLPFWFFVAQFTGIIGASLAIVFGIIGMARGYSNSNIFVSKGFSIASFILGIIVLAITMAVLFSVIVI